MSCELFQKGLFIFAQTLEVLLISLNKKRMFENLFRHRIEIQNFKICIKLKWHVLDYKEKFIDND